jgi:shikimate kinase
MNIILMGYRCTGKTSAGRCLARQMGYPFFDTDELVQLRTGRTIAQIVAEAGWDAFREAERAAVGEAAGAGASVIALGGGAVCDARNVELLKKNGFFVWLFAAPEAIAARIERDTKSGANRPSLTGARSDDEVRAVLAEREPRYRGLADLAIETTRFGSEEVAAAIRKRLGELAHGERKEE